MISVTKFGESHSQAMHQFVTIKDSLHSKGIFLEVQKVMKEYFDQEHAEKGFNFKSKFFYQPLYIVHKESCTTTKILSFSHLSTRVSLNSTLMVGPTVHPSLIDVLTLDSDITALH